MDKLGASALDEIMKAKEDMEIKVIERMLSLKVEAMELDPVVPPQNEFDPDRIDYRKLIYRLLIRGKLERMSCAGTHGHIPIKEE